MANDTLHYIYSYIINKYNIDNEELISNTYYYVNRVLNTELVKNRNEIVRIKKQIEELEWDMEHLRSGIVGKENFDFIGAGRNNGGSKNNVEIAFIEICNIKTEIKVLIAKKRELCIKFEAHDKRIKKFLDLLNNDTHKLVLELSMFYGMKSTDIVDQYLPYYTSVYVRKMKNIAKSKLAGVLKKYVENLAKKDKKE